MHSIDFVFWLFFYFSCAFFSFKDKSVLMLFPFSVVLMVAPDFFQHDGFLKYLTRLMAVFLLGAFFLRAGFFGGMLVFVFLLVFSTFMAFAGYLSIYFLMALMGLGAFVWLMCLLIFLNKKSLFSNRLILIERWVVSMYLKLFAIPITI